MPRQAIIVFILALFGMVTHPQRALASCDFESWLTNVFVVTSNLSHSLDNGAQRISAQSAKHLITRYSLTDLRLELRSRGMKQHEKTVAQYILRHKSLLETYRKRGPQAATSLAQKLIGTDITGPMKDMIGDLRCATDPNWSPGPILSQLTGVSLWHEMTNWLIVLGLFLVCLAAVLSLSLWQRRNRRRTKRYLCRIPVGFSAVNKTADAHLVDIGLLGAKVGLHAELAKGLPCRLSLPDRSLAARVVWSNGEYCGVEFHSPLTSRALDAILNADEHAQKESGAALARAASKVFGSPPDRQTAGREECVPIRPRPR